MPNRPPMLRMALASSAICLLPACAQDKESTKLTARLASEASGPPAGVPPKYAVLWNGLFTPDKDVQALKRSLPYDQIILERSPCFGSCPVYKLRLNRDGTAEYEGIKYTEKDGRHTGKLGLGTFARLCYFLEKEKFESLESKYRANWTDDTTCTISVYKDGKLVKSVGDYGQQGPIELWAIQELIDGIGEQIDWSLASVTRPRPKTK